MEDTVLWGLMEVEHPSSDDRLADRGLAFQEGDSPVG